MKTVIISPNSIKIIEPALDFVTSGTWKYKVIPYLDKYDDERLITEKSVIAVKDKSEELLALDGNKLCFAGRLVQKYVQCKILENENDKNCLDRSAYKSQMIWDKTISEVAKQDCDFFWNPNAAWRYDIPRFYCQELKHFGIQFQVEQMMFQHD
ncbi:MAG: hypothetical protein ABSB94_16405 [Syntrophorhabdales bacterium]|jgi:hypothetical protein